MTTPTSFQSLGLSFEYSTPVALGTVKYLGNLTREVTAYSHIISSFGGFDAATVSIADYQLRLDDWIMSGLGRHIVVYGDHNYIIWEGFVNQITYTAGALTMTVGPLMDIGNRVSVKFSEVDASVSSVTGTSATTIIAEDADSQDAYGIIEKILSGGSMYRDEANQVRDVFLADKRLAPSSKNYSFSAQPSTTNPIIKLDCKGYSSWLEAFIYENYVNGVDAASDKIEDVIDADPNSIVLTKKLDANASLVVTLEDQGRSGLTVIKGCVNMGDGSDNRWLFGMYENREAVFEVMPSTVEYTYEISDEIQRISSNTGGIVKPWDVRAGKWIETTGILTTSGAPSPGLDLRSDLRNTFIESVSFTMPNTLSISGTTVDRAPQALAKYGIGAMV